MYLVGAAEITFHSLRRGDYGDPAHLDVRGEDASAFFPYRIANLQRIYPYIPDSLNNILMRYSKRAEGRLDNYKSMDTLADDLGDLDLAGSR